ncbi:MAG: tetratricopeptide repeat protein [Oscillatoria sp. SIO1A7]|nr:tetratricopeptide repeat protein [Oscillatoria sp. SIO1A7]
MLRELQVNNVPVQGLCPPWAGYANDSASARTVERLGTGTLFPRKSLTIGSYQKFNLMFFNRSRLISKKISREIFLPLIAGVLPLAIAASSIASEERPIQLGVIIQAEGSVELKRPGWKTYQPTGVGAAVFTGDLLKPAAGITVLVQCSSGEQWPVPAGIPSGVANGCAVIDEGGDGYDGTRSSELGGINANIPYVISPRKTSLLDSRPTISWNPVEGTTNYSVRVQGPGVDWRQRNVSATELAYPEQEAPLQPGGYYQVIVKAENQSSSIHDKGTKLGFRLLSEEASDRILEQVARIQEQDWSEPEKTLAIAHLYSQQDLRIEAIELLHTLTEQGSQPATIFLMLGELYWQVELPLLARDNYLQAFQLAQEEGNLWQQTKAAASLAELYEAIEEKEEASQWSDRAREGYEALDE